MGGQWGRIDLDDEWSNAMRSNPTKPDLDRAAGALLGLAVGDALGAGYEFTTPAAGADIQMRGGGACNWAPGEWTDDTAQAVAIAEVLSTGATDLLAIGQRFLDWRASGPKDIGIQTSAVLSAAGTAGGLTQAAAVHFGRNPKGAAGNGSLMRTAPVALARLGDDAGIAALAREVSLLTHGDPLAAEACVLWCIAIDRAVRKARLDGARDGLALLPADRRAFWDTRLTEAETLPPSTFTPNGFVVTALQAAHAAISQTPIPTDEPCRHLQDALVAAVRIGHDTDTVAAIAGQVLGARWGATAVPWRWRRILHGWPDHAADDLIRLAVLTARKGKDDPIGWPSAPSLMVEATRNETTPWCGPLPSDPDVLVGNLPGLGDALAQGVDAVVSLCRVGTKEVPDAIEHHRIRLIDKPGAQHNANLDFVLRDAVEAVATLRAEGKRVFLHCHGGRSRTAAVAISYLSQTTGLSTAEALAQIRTVLPEAHLQVFGGAGGGSLRGTGERGLVEMIFDRVVSDELMAALSDDGPFAWVVDLVRDDDHGVLDLQLRRVQRGKRSWASLYAGLTKLVDVEERGGEFRLTAHATHRTAGAFDDAWSSWRPASAWADMVPEIQDYLSRAREQVSGHHLLEGQVHAVLCRPGQFDFSVIQREASPAFADREVREQVFAEVAGPLVSALGPATGERPWWPVPTQGAPSLGGSVDVLAVDDAGRLLVIEAKPAGTASGLAKAPLQVRVYAELFDRLLGGWPETVPTLRKMLGQRVALGLSASREIPDKPAVVPVIAIGPGHVSDVAMERMRTVGEALPPSRSMLGLEEVWVSAAEVGWDPTLGGSGWSHEARSAAIAWKATSPLIDEAAREPGTYKLNDPTYPFCLPRALAMQNLLPGSRDAVRQHFANAGIVWHSGVDGGPTSHLVSSQVQCVNVFGPGLTDPEAAKRILDLVVDVEEVLPAKDPDNHGDYVAFEWIGTANHLGEWGAAAPTRGANVTSADAMLRYRTSSGTTEMVLVEWKYTESYSGQPLSGGPNATATRRTRYEALATAPGGPLDLGGLDVEDLFVEPIYQLMRLQLLAWAIEHADPDLDRVHLVHAVPKGNTPLLTGIPHALKVRGATIHEVWRSLLTPEGKARFHVLDTTRLITDNLVSHDTINRYGHMAEEIQR